MLEKLIPHTTHEVDQHVVSGGVRRRVRQKFDTLAPTRVWQGKGAGRVSPEVALDAALQTHVAPAKYAYKLIVGLHSAPGSTSNPLAR